MRILGLALFIGCTALLTASVSARAAHVLITEEEARLPPLKGAIALGPRGITRGPKINLVATDQPVHSPMHLQLKFEAYGGAKIDPDSVKLTYLKTPNVDLTARVKPFVQPTGIDILDAELPVGDHFVRVDLRDSDGRIGGASFVLKIIP